MDNKLTSEQCLAMTKEAGAAMQDRRVYTVVSMTDSTLERLINAAYALGRKEAIGECVEIAARHFTDTCERHGLNAGYLAIAALRADTEIKRAFGLES